MVSVSCPRVSASSSASHSASVGRSPTQFAIKTKFRAVKPEGRCVSAQGAGRHSNRVRDGERGWGVHLSRGGEREL